MSDTCEYSHTGTLVTGWECPHPPEAGSRCPFHTESDISKAELSRFTEAEAVRADDGTVPAIGAVAETIPADASAHPLDLREASTAVVAVGTEVTNGLDLSGAALDRVDLRRTTVRGDLRLVAAEVGEVRLDQARIKKEFDCSGATVERFVADGGRFEMMCDLHGVDVTGTCRMVESHVGGILELTDSTVAGPLLLNNSVVESNVGLAGGEFRDRLIAEHVHVRGTCNAVDSVVRGTVTFRRSEFRDVVDFSRSTFESEVRFDVGTTFEAEARFDEVRFKRRARFSGASFGAQTEFTDARFGDIASFTGANFDDAVSFGERTVFDGRAEFNGVTFRGPATFDTATFGTAVFDSVQSTDSISFENAQAGTITLTGAAVDEVNCRHLRCDSRLRLEDATVDGEVDLSYGRFSESVILRGTTVSGGVTCVGTTLRDEFDCREADVSGTIELTGSDTDSLPTSDADPDDYQVVLDGHAGFAGATVGSLVVDGVRLTHPVVAEELRVDRIVVAPEAGSTTVVDLTDATLDAGTLDHPATGTVRYDLEGTLLGDVTLSPGPDEAAPLEPYWIVRTEFDGFKFSDHRAMLTASDWRIHGSPPGDQVSLVAREMTYLAAKNGANQVSDRDAAGEFFKRQLRSRRGRYRDAALSGRPRERVRAAAAWVANGVLDLTAVYGEAPSRVFVSSVVTVVLFSVASLLMARAELSGAALIRRTLFSIQAFTAFVFGQPEVPATFLIQWVVALEGFLGAFFTGLFIFALTRSVSR